MSLLQVSTFDACYKCNISVSTSDMVNCSKSGCNAKYHKACVPMAEGVEQWICPGCEEESPPTICHRCEESVASDDKIQCTICITAYHKTCVNVAENVQPWKCEACTQKEEPKKAATISSRSAKSVRSSNSSRSSSYLREMQLKILEEKQKLLERQHHEKEFQLKEKHRQENELIEMKLRLLKECDEPPIALDVAEEKPSDKVAGWLKQGNENNMTPKKLPHNSNPETAPATFIIHPPQLSSTTNHFKDPKTQLPPTNDAKDQSTQILQPKPKMTSGTVNNSFTSFDSSIIAARHVIGNKLTTFDGNPVKWPRFLSQFQNTTKLCQITDAENLDRLTEALKGNALKAVEKLLYMPENVASIIEILGKVFGRPEYIVNTQLEEIRSEPRPRYDDFDSIIAYSLQVNNLCATMVASSMSEHLWNPMLTKELVEKLPTQMIHDWANYKTSITSSAINLEVFNTWLESKAVSLTSVLSKPPQLVHTKQSKSSKGYLNLHSNEESSCIICLKKCENLPSCPTFIEASYPEKWEFVKTHNLCRICLGRHQGRCRSGKKCESTNCIFKHHTLLHKPTQNQQQQTETEQEDVNLHNESSSSTLFKVIPVCLYGKDNKTVHTYAFLDEGSSVTLLDNSVAEELQLSGTRQPLCLKWTNNQSATDYESRKVAVSIGCAGDNKRFIMKDVRTIKNLKLPHQSQNVVELQLRYPHLKNIPVKSFANVQPQILIGLDNVQLCSTNKIKAGSTNEPIAAKTLLGWSICGSTQKLASGNYNLHVCECEELSKTVKHFISFDHLAVNDDCQLTRSDQKAIKSMESSIKFLDGQYECGLLWRFKEVDLPESLEMAKRRSHCLVMRLAKDPVLYQTLDDKIDDYISKSYARKLPPSEITENIEDNWYLPVFPVVNPNKPGKVRLVWDAAAKSHNVCLNDFLYKGPDLLNSLPGILLRFRENKIGLAGDIAEMFHQIKLLGTERKFHRFLWQRRNERTPSTYEMTVLSFGAACSPCISQFVKNHHASKYSSIYPRAVTAIHKNHYVDDWLDSFNSEDEALLVSSEVSKILSSGGFIMRNWISNSTIFSNSMECSKALEKDLSETDDHTEKVLGMYWQTSSDSFTFSLKFNKGNREVLEGKRLPTKRELLRIMMSVYDPLGLVAHVIVYSKILLQKVWQSKIQWDDTIEDGLGEYWSDWISMLFNIQNFRIPRWYSQGLENVEYELHTFVDGSEQAFAAVTYILCIGEDKNVCQLASSKTRTAPLKPLSIPRLELQSAVLGARLAKFVQDNQNITFKRRVFWTDSRTVMCWLKSEPKKFKQFVTCRLAEILELSEVEEWRWVSTLSNPADIATRMKVPTEESHSTWFNGPAFLRSSQMESENSKDDFSSLPPEAQEELRAQVFFHHCVSEALITVEDFSTYRNLRRRYFFVFWCTATWKKCLKLPYVSLTAPEIYEMVDIFLIRQAQNEIYGDEIIALLHNKPVERSSSLLKCSPYMDENKVLRTRGRIDYAPDVLQNTKRPIIMPPGHPITMLIIDKFHQRFYHKNHETVINELRQQFFILRLRAELKKVVSNCQHCKNEKALPTMPEEAPLPPARLSSYTRPFTYTGIDFFGPIIVTIGRRSEKRWGLLATCLTIRAVHIELASSLTTSSCVLALRNFMNRRGKSHEIYCDNGTNFRGASRELRQAIEALDLDQISKEFADNEIKWCFNPPAAPHMGGSWERLVRSVKSNLHAITSSRTFKEEVLRSLLIEVENIINSRPLTYIPIEDENAEALTPNHFLVGSSNGNKPIGAFSDNVLILRSHWTTSQKLTDIFWKRWVHEFLPTLVRRTKWFSPNKPVEVGDIVLVFEDGLPRSCYPKGKVMDVTKGRDGNVRKVTVKTIKGIYDRPVAKIAVLDVLKRSVDSETQHGGGEMLTRDPVNHQTNERENSQLNHI